MTLEEAVAVLNREKHRSCGEWFEADNEGSVWVQRPKNDNDWLTPFEAIAIAEKYECERDIELLSEKARADFEAGRTTPIRIYHSRTDQEVFPAGDAPLWPRRSLTPLPTPAEWREDVEFIDCTQAFSAPSKEAS